MRISPISRYYYSEMLVNYELEQDWSIIGGLGFDQEAKKWKIQFKLRVGNDQQEVQEIRGQLLSIDQTTSELYSCLPETELR